MTSLHSAPAPRNKSSANFGAVGQCLPAHSRRNPEVQAQLDQLAQMGFDRDLIDVVPKGFILSSSGRRVSSAQVAELWQDFNKSATPIHERAYVAPDPWYIASRGAVSQIKVHVHDPFNFGWDDFIRYALEEWNRADLQSCIHITFVDTPQAADCRVQTYWADDLLLGAAEWPRGQRVGVEVNINVRYFSEDYDEAFYFNTIVHEMGHAMGLAHSGGEDGSFEVPDLLLPGTSPDPHPDDLMYTSGHPWKGFSEDERLAIKALWPVDGKV